MPSTLKQKGIIISSKNKNSKNQRTYIIVSQKTGFMDVTINNTRYSYNNVQSYSANTRNIYYKAVSAATQNKKQTITIRRIG